MKDLLFVTPPTEDYLSDGMLVGLKQILGARVVDFPKRDSLYKSFGAQQLAECYGRGFTLFGTLEDEAVDRSGVYQRLLAGEFGGVIVGELWWNWGWVLQNLPILAKTPTVLLDGVDSMRVFPCSGEHLWKPYGWTLPKLHRHFPTLKRELSSSAAKLGLLERFLPDWLTRMGNRLSVPKGLFPTAFSIPEEKIVVDLPEKTKQFPSHIVDEEVQQAVAGSGSSYAFDTEQEYYADLRASRFGITTKRAGWDCMRHYEIAANAAVICFRDLDLKPETCAPHGLVDGENCIAYKSVPDLMARIESLSEQRYQEIQQNSLAWVRSNTCRVRAQHLLNTYMAIGNCETVS